MWALYAFLSGYISEIRCIYLRQKNGLLVEITQHYQYSWRWTQDICVHVKKEVSVTRGYSYSRQTILKGMEPISDYAHEQQQLQVAIQNIHFSL